MFPFPGAGLLHIDSLSCHTQWTHTRVINATHTWTFLTKHEGGSVCFFVYACASTNENSKSLGDNGESLWSTSFPCCSSTRAQPPHVKRGLLNTLSSLFWLLDEILRFIRTHQWIHNIYTFYLWNIEFPQTTRFTFICFILLDSIYLHVNNRSGILTCFVLKPSGQSERRPLGWCQMCATRVSTCGMDVLTVANAWSENCTSNLHRCSYKIFMLWHFTW